MRGKAAGRRRGGMKAIQGRDGEVYKETDGRQGVVVTVRLDKRGPG